MRIQEVKLFELLYGCVYFAFVGALGTCLLCLPLNLALISLILIRGQIVVTILIKISGTNLTRVQEVKIA